MVIISTQTTLWVHPRVLVDSVSGKILPLICWNNSICVVNLDASLSFSIMRFAPLTSGSVYHICENKSIWTFSLSTSAIVKTGSFQHEHDQDSNSKFALVIKVRLWSQAPVVLLPRIVPLGHPALALSHLFQMRAWSSRVSTWVVCEADEWRSVLDGI